MLTNDQIEELAERMEVPLVFCGFKSDIPKTIQASKAYIINLDNEYDTEGKRNGGTHWTCFYVVQYPNGKTESIYFDSYGVSPPEIVKVRLRRNFGLTYVPYTKKNVQSLISNACGYFCLAFLHFICTSQYRTKSLYDDVCLFLELFYDLETTIDFKYNEYVLKMFFQSKDETKRKPIVLNDPVIGDDMVVLNSNQLSK
jgi:hypothetical protein